MDMLSFIDQGLRGHSHDHGGRCDVLAGLREFRCLPPALLDLIVHLVCPRSHALGVEVLRARASIVVAFIGLISFMGPGSFKALLVILGLLPRGAWNRIGIVLCFLRRCCTILRDVQHVAFS